eukprot:10800482-Alexandrium_andersonii.AAC.1
MNLRRRPRTHKKSKIAQMEEMSSSKPGVPFTESSSPLQSVCRKAGTYKNKGKRKELCDWPELAGAELDEAMTSLS